MHQTLYTIFYTIIHYNIVLYKQRESDVFTCTDILVMWEMCIANCNNYFIYINYLMSLYFKLWTPGTPHLCYIFLEKQK